VQIRPGNARKTERARALRAVENEAEDALWNELRGRRLNGWKFVRQLPIGPYFADFACRQANLVVEVDGSQHASQPSDRFRDETMNGNGWSVLRVWNVDVLRDRRTVLEMILAAVEGRMNGKMISAEARFLPAVRDNEG
jgi:very-short-patch-repair endonuclease